MKRTTLFFTILSALTLTSCDVHFGNIHYDVPWWVIAIPTGIILFAVYIIGGIILSKNEYVCPHCNKTFSPKWWKAAYSIHLNSDRVLKCPHCKKRSLCKIKRVIK
ncbi:MAG: hypothetical protein IJ400_02255 [Clostridia bacterium]|nr:hypothetical protein [Clostridia bacterium]